MTITGLQFIICYISKEKPVKQQEKWLTTFTCRRSTVCQREIILSTLDTEKTKCAKTKQCDLVSWQPCTSDFLATTTSPIPGPHEARSSRLYVCVVCGSLFGLLPVTCIIIISKHHQINVISSFSLFRYIIICLGSDNKTPLVAPSRRTIDPNLPFRHPDQTTRPTNFRTCLPHPRVRL